MTDLLVDKYEHATVWTLNRPHRMNAMGGTLIEELTEAVCEFEADPAQHVAILTGAGEKAFCAGADLKEMAESASSGRRLPVVSTPDIAGLAACEKVTIAAVNGVAIAGGLELSLCCDIRIASSNATFGVFEVKRGILAGIAVNVLPRLMPIGAVMDLMLCAGQLTAEDAFRLGLIQDVVSPDDLIPAALRRAAMVSSNSQAAVRGTKQVLRFWRDAMMTEQVRYYQAVMHRVLLSGDVFEGPLAFAERREPQFSPGFPDPFALLRRDTEIQPED
jgi:enoyl-CoA hydratase/carnithine racemase